MTHISAVRASDSGLNSWFPNAGVSARRIHCSLCKQVLLSMCSLELLTLQYANTWSPARGVQGVSQLLYHAFWWRLTLSW